MPDKSVRFLGIVDKIRQIRTKKGDDMAFATISDLTGAISVTIFPNLFKNIQNILNVGTVLQFIGKSEVDSRGELAIVANQIQTITKPHSKGTWYLQFDVAHDTPDNRKKLIKVLAKHHGNNPVIIHWQQEGKNQQLDESFWMTDETVIILEVAPIIGEENVIFRKTR
ncbi:MAG: OB-fold nucleic acid binding domain-containing protein [Leuconostoc falkenbergense]